MATVNYSLRSKKSPTSIYVRFINGRAYNIASPLPLSVRPEHWDKNNQKIRNIIQVRNRDEINKRLALLKIHIVDAFNISFVNGDIIDTEWLRKTCFEFFNRPNDEGRKKADKSKIYYTDFAYWWLENKGPEWLVSENKYLSDREIGKYESFLRMVEDYQEKSKLRLKDLEAKEISNFAKYLSENSYAASTIKRHINRFKFFLFRAEAYGLKVNQAFKQRVFTPKSEPLKKPFFDEGEIEKLFNHDFSGSKSLEDVRDNAIIACWTGLRVSDFLGKLDISNFIDDFIEITTTKTGAKVAIPIHPHVKDILIKRKGKLPKQISDVKFNKYIKTVCRRVGFNEVIKGSLYNSDKKRNVIDFYPKWKLISSHIGRRSFATNHYGKIPNKVIMGVCGWSKVDMMLHYIQRSDTTHALELQKYWDETYS